MDIPVRDWTFTHLWVRPVTKVWFNIYHKSITYSGTENIDWEKPIIFAPSHRNAFTDALCIITSVRHRNNRIIYPLIRADAFGNSKLIDWILTSFHMMPVYRPRDKVNMAAKNNEVFDHCYDLLAEKRNLLIHPEGNCIPENRVRSFKKGLARIAFGAEEKYDFSLDVNIIPVGITYGEITEARKGIHVQYGTPVRVAEFKDEYQKNAVAAINNLTQLLHEKVKSLSVDLPAKNYQLSEELLKLNKSVNRDLLHRPLYGVENLRINQRIAKSMKKITRDDDKKVKELSAKMDDLKKLLARYRLKLDLPLAEPSSTAGLILKAIGFLILFPLAIYGLINNMIPAFVMHRLAGKIKEKQFISSARMTLGLLFFPVCYILQTIIVFFLTPWWIWAVVYLASLPFSWLLVLNWWENARFWWQQTRFHWLPEEAKQKIQNLTQPGRKILKNAKF